MKAITLRDGRIITYRDAGGGTPLVLLHGWAMSSCVFQEMQELMEGSFRVLVPDLRGHGGSTAGSSFSLDECAADLHEWMGRLGLGPVHLFGWSLGGQVAMVLQQTFPEAVQTLGLLSSTPCFVVQNDWPAGLPAVQVLAMKRNLKRNYVRTMGEFFDLQFQDAPLPKERYRAVCDFAVRQGRLPDLSVAMEALDTLAGGDLRPQLTSIPCPVLIQHGDRDVICPVEAAREMAQGVPLSQLSIVAGTGHAPFLSRPRDVASHWKDFLG